MGLALAEGLICEPVHRERIRVQLDSGAGYGARLQFLGIEMAPEEQFAYFTENDSRVERALEKGNVWRHLPPSCQALRERVQTAS
jgi:hypothetical protein